MPECAEVACFAKFCSDLLIESKSLLTAFEIPEGSYLDVNDFAALQDRLSTSGLHVKQIQSHGKKMIMHLTGETTSCYLAFSFGMGAYFSTTPVEHKHIRATMSFSVNIDIHYLYARSIQGTIEYLCNEARYQSFMSSLGPSVLSTVNGQRLPTTLRY